MTDLTVDAADLAALDAAIDRALESGDESDLDVIGYGEISSVVRRRFGDRDLACKRLPLFDSQQRFDDYAACFAQYLGRLSARGIRVIPSTLAAHPRDDGRIAGYCLQPALGSEALATAHLRAIGDAESAATFFDGILDRVLAAVDRTTGFDGQLSNWVVLEGELAYLDVTTPLMRDSAGRELLDGELFLASLPWALRRVVRRFMLQSILETYYDPRRVIVDFLGNLIKERLDQWLPQLIAQANDRDIPPITDREVRDYYRSDARVWAVLQRLRHADRFWQRKVRRRTYPFLLPGAIER